MEIKVREDFAAAGGCSTGLQWTGLYDDAEVLGVEFEKSAVATARAAGHNRLHADVRSDEVRELRWGKLDGYSAGPPCQTFSMAGSGTGRAALGALSDAAHRVAQGVLPEKAVEYSGFLDERSLLVLEPMLVISRHRPEWIMLEQVPGVLPVWEAYAEVLRSEFGYSVETAKLNAEQYGVPQTRKRAILVARLTASAVLPTPTHSRFHSRSPERLDEGVQKWVSMAEALNWSNQSEVVSNYGSGGDPAARGRRLGSQPSATVTSKVNRNKVYHPRPRWVPEFNDQSGTPFDPEWPEKRPATVVAGRGLVQNPGATANRYNGSTKSRNDGVKVSVAEAAVLQSFPADYPFQGTLGKQYQQVGNAKPPLMAHAVLSALLSDRMEVK